MARDDDFKPIDDMLRHANPNPDRIGCPSAEELRALALRERSISDPLYDHLSKCSECFAAVREIQRAHGVQPQTAPGDFTRWWMVGAAILCVVAGSIWFVKRAQLGNAPPIVAKSQPQLPSAVLDLRPFAISRGDEPVATVPPLELPRTHQTVVIQLPIASAEGEYSLKLLNAELVPQMNSNPTARLRSGITTISTDLDLGKVPVGKYTLALKRKPEDWRYFPLVLR